MCKVIDLTGKTFDRLTVLGRAPRPEYYAGTTAFWLCRCSCGNEKVVDGAALRRCLTRSCGCLKQEKDRRMMRGLATRRRKEKGARKC